MTNMAMSVDFLSAFARLPGQQQRGVRALIARFNNDSAASGLNYERINGAKDPKHALAAHRPRLPRHRSETGAAAGGARLERAAAGARRRWHRQDGGRHAPPCPLPGANAAGRPHPVHHLHANLAADIEHNPGTICTPEEMERIEVTNLDRWGGALSERPALSVPLQFGRLREAWQIASTPGRHR